jgi:hypothetical protein
VVRSCKIPKYFEKISYEKIEKRKQANEPIEKKMNKIHPLEKV